jgi:hypothetical protein
VVLLPAAEAAQQPGDVSQLPSLPSHISTFGDDGTDELQQEDSCSDADTAAGRPSLEQQRQRSVRFDDEGAGAAVLDAITAASQLPSHISAFGDDLGSNEQGGCTALAGSDELEPEAPASEWRRMVGWCLHAQMSNVAVHLLLLHRVAYPLLLLLFLACILPCHLSTGFNRRQLLCLVIKSLHCLFWWYRWSWAIWPAGCRLWTSPHARLQLLPGWGAWGSRGGPKRRGCRPLPA